MGRTRAETGKDMLATQMALSIEKRGLRRRARILACVATMIVSAVIVVLGSPKIASGDQGHASGGAVINISASTLGGTGTFGYHVEDVGGSVVGSATVKTTFEGKETLAEPASISVPVGTYRITQAFPNDRTGKWQVNSVNCNGVDQTGDLTTIVVDATGQGVSCSFQYELVPQGSIRIRKTSFGGVGTFDFVITRGAARYIKSATTASQGKTVVATGDATTSLDLGSYEIQELLPAAGGDGVWQLNGLQCNGEAVPTEQGRAVVRLTENRPDLDCSYVNELVGGTGENPVDPLGQVSLSVVKTVSPKSIDSGQTVVYAVKIINRGPSAATNVTVTEQLSSGAGIVSFSGAQCRRKPFPTCSVGTLAAGAKKVVRVRVRPRSVGRLENRVAVNSANPESSIRDNTDKAFIRVLTEPNFTG